MAGLDCAEVSPAAWPTLRDGIHGDGHGRRRRGARGDARAGRAGLAIGECGAAPLAALRALTAGRAFGLGAHSRVLLIATEGPTDPDAYRARSAPPERGVAA